MRALLLAAGLGTRLKPLTDTVPKCLVDIRGRPLLEYWIELLLAGGIENILINLHHLPEAIHSYLRAKAYQANILTTFEERLLGTAGTLRENHAFFQGGPAMVIHADNLTRFDVRAFMDRYYWRPENVEITMMTFRTDDPVSCGIVELDDSGIVQGFHEKVPNPPGNLANAAVYIVSPGVQAYINALQGDAIDFSTEILPKFIGRINTYHNADFHRDIGTPEQLAKARLED